MPSDLAIPLWIKFRDYLEKLGPAPTIGNSWYVSYQFCRPTPTWKSLKTKLDGILKPFMTDPNPHPFQCQLDSNFSIHVFPSSLQKETFFRAIGHSDEQSGGWLISEVETNLKHCVIEKTAKITKYAGKYLEWWLVLPDHIGYSLDEFERELFLNQIKVKPGLFSKIILVDPLDASRALQVYPKK